MPTGGSTGNGSAEHWGSGDQARMSPATPGGLRASFSTEDSDSQEWAASSHAATVLGERVHMR
eukprot:15310342-Alexandrium_andersonii.AAC.1